MIEDSLVFFDHEIMIVDSHRSIIVRDEKDENLSIKLFLALYRSKKFDKSSYDDDYVVRVLTIDNV